jgi:hypothetical protein
MVSLPFRCSSEVTLINTNTNKSYTLKVKYCFCNYCSNFRGILVSASLVIDIFREIHSTEVYANRTRFNTTLCSPGRYIFCNTYRWHMCLYIFALFSNIGPCLIFSRTVGSDTVSDRMPFCCRLSLHSSCKI